MHEYGRWIALLFGRSFFRMTIDSPLMDLIKEDQVKGVRSENWKKERIRGHISRFPLIVDGF